MCSDAEFIDLNPELQKYCFCFIKDSDFLEIRQLENFRELIKENDLLTQFINELNQIQMIEFNVGYLQLNESLHSLDYVLLNVIDAYSNYSDSLDDGYISPFELSQEFTNFFADQAIEQYPISEIIEGVRELIESKEAQVISRKKIS
jgi:hypothetical protein